VPPDSTLKSALASLDSWTPRADAAIFHLSVPYRAHDLTIFVTVDPTNGLDRSAEDSILSLSRS
jgi:hypothetical protein